MGPRVASRPRGGIGAVGAVPVNPEGVSRRMGADPRARLQHLRGRRHCSAVEPCRRDGGILCDEAAVSRPLGEAMTERWTRSAGTLLNEAGDGLSSLGLPERTAREAGGA